MGVLGAETFEGVARACGLGRGPLRFSEGSEGLGEEEAGLGLLVRHPAPRVPVHRVLKQCPAPVRLARRERDRPSGERGGGAQGRRADLVSGGFELPEGLPGIDEFPERGAGAREDLVGLDPLQPIRGGQLPQQALGEVCRLGGVAAVECQQGQPGLRLRQERDVS